MPPSNHYLHNVPLLFGDLYKLAYGHIDELVLSFSLHHSRALRPDHLNGLWNIYVTVQSWDTVRRRKEE